MGVDVVKGKLVVGVAFGMVQRKLHNFSMWL